jgi:hypothetical protein
VPDRGQAAQAGSCAPILSDLEADRRLLLLTELQAALSLLGVRSVLARNQRLVLRYRTAPHEPSGLTDPQLHIFTGAGKRVATTDGEVYQLDQGGQFTARDAAAAATLICGARG